MRPGRCAAGLALLLPFALVACGGGSKAAPAPTTTPRAAPTTTTVGPGPTPSESVVTGSTTPTPTDAPLRLTDDQAAQVLISPGNLPTPYQVDPSVSPDTRIGLPPGCAALDQVGAAIQAAPVLAARGFVGGTVYPLLEERVAVLADGADEQLTRFGRALTTCHTFDSSDPDGTSVRFLMAPLTALAADAHTVALTMTGRVTPGAGDRVVTNAVLVSRGDVLVLFVHSGLGVLDPAVVAAAVQRATQILDKF